MDSPHTLATDMIADAGHIATLRAIGEWLVTNPRDWRACFALFWAVLLA